MIYYEKHLFSSLTSMVVGNEDVIKQSTSSELLLNPSLEVGENSSPHRARLQYLLKISKNSEFISDSATSWFNYAET